jgi:succinate dehydrogenase/fumarate reductase cytochrome b subunit
MGYMAKTTQSKTLRLILDFFTVLFDMIYGLWRMLWNLNRGLVKALMPGQHKSVHTVVTYLVVMLEIVGLWVAAVAWAAKN